MLPVSLLFLATSALASPIASIRDYAHALEGRAVTVSANDFTNFKFYVQHSAAAYCNSETPAGTAITCAGRCPGLEGDKATIVKSFVGKLTGIGGYIATDLARQEIVLSFRGSNNIRNWLTNLNFAQIPCDLVKDCTAHAGFMSAWNEVASIATAAIQSASAANPGFKVVTTGHSLGGAVATIAAAYLRKGGFPADVYTYGSPRVGNVELADFVSTQAGGEFRLTHIDDPVPRLPPIIFGFRHTTPEFWLDGGDATTTDYSIQDIKVCEGTANLRCNGGTLGLDVEAHGFYFQKVPGCDGDTGIQLRQLQDMTDAELEAKLNYYVAQDLAYVKDHGLD